jgi:hypothetical protein
MHVRAETIGTGARPTVIASKNEIANLLSITGVS